MTTAAAKSPSQYLCDTPRPDDEADLQRLHALSMPGALSFATAVAPDHRLALGVQGDVSHVRVIRRRSDGRIVAAGARSVLEVFIGGKAARLGYLGGLRNEPGVRLPRGLIVDAYRDLWDTRDPGDADFDLTCIMADNTTARRALERGFRGMPTYTPLGELVTLTVPTCAERPMASPYRRAIAADVPATAELLERDGTRFTGRPRWTADAIASPERCRGLRPDHFVLYQPGDRVSACGAVWDQRGFKQTILTDLSPTLARTRSMINVGCRVLNRVPLPSPGDTLSMVFASHLVLPSTDNAATLALIDALRSVAGGMDAEAMVFALPADHAFLKSNRLRRMAWQVRSVVYAVHYGDPPALDGRPVWPEAAIL